MIKCTITHICKDENGTITHVLATSAVEPKGVQLTKIEVVHNIATRLIRYVVANNGEETPVRVVDGRYIRSVPNDIMEDNLGELPLFRPR